MHIRKNRLIDADGFYAEYTYPVRASQEEMSVPKGRWYPGSNRGVQRRKTDGKRLPCRSIRCPQTVRKMGEVSNFCVFSLKVQRLSIDNPESEL